MRIRKKTNKKLKKNNKRTRKFRKNNKRRVNLGGGEENKRKRGERGESEEELLSLDEINKRAREEKKQQRLKELEEEAEKQLEIIRLKELHSMLPPLSKRETPILPEKNVVQQSASRGYTGHAQVSTNEIDNFVKEKITDGPQIVNFAVGNYNHAILVDVVHKDNKVLIADWKGDPRLSFQENSSYRNYFELLAALKKKYNCIVEYYPVDLYLKNIADIKNAEKRNAGGCSEYLYNWINVYYRPGHYAYPF